MLQKNLVRSLLSLLAALSFSATLATGGDILFIVADPTGGAYTADALIKSRLEALGHTVRYFDDNNNEAAMEDAAAAADLVYISESVGSGNVHSKITEIEVPIIVGEPWAWDEMGMTLGSGGSGVVATNDLDIVNSGHYLAAGLSGTVPVISNTMGPEGPAEFANQNGWALVEAAVNYALGVTERAAVAKNPQPAEGATDVPRDVILNWKPGDFAPASNAHRVFLSEVFTDVDDGLGSIAQDANSYDPGGLDFETTYYWRVDEVNAPPDSTVHRGAVWSFTTEPIGYPIENVTVTASSFIRDSEKPENVINGSGLDEDDLHSSDSATMWLSDIMDPNIAWIQFEFDKSYKLYQMLVWNYNSTVEPAVGFGIKEATIEYSVDGVNWSVLGTAHEFAQGPGEAGYASDTTVDLLGVIARYVRITANSNWSPWGLKQYGLSEVRLLYTPIWAREPSPDSGATDVPVGGVMLPPLTWPAHTTGGSMRSTRPRRPPLGKAISGTLRRRNISSSMASRTTTIGRPTRYTPRGPMDTRIPQTAPRLAI
jgi:hypothetical protein